MRGVVVEPRREIGPRGGRQVELDVIERAGTRRGAEAVLLSGPGLAPAEHAVRVQAELRDVRWRDDRIERRIDLERERLVREVQRARARGDALAGVLRRLVVPAEREVGHHASGHDAGEV